MTQDDLRNQLEQLRQLHEQGLLSEANLRAALTGLGVRPEAVFDQQGQQVEQQVNVAGNVYLGPPAQDPAEALAIYRRVLAQTCSHLPLRGVDVGASDATAGQKPLGLANVYVDLDTTARVPVAKDEKKKRDRALLPQEWVESRPLSALEAAVANRRLVLLGDPGGGKTTFVHHLAHCLACGAMQALPGWPQSEAGRLPLLVVLRDFAHDLPDPLPRRAEPRHLWDFVVERLEAQRMGFAAAPLVEALEEGQALILLDGLDEVGTEARRVFVRDAVTAFAARYPRNRFLVTCRVLSYQPPAWRDAPDLRLPDFPAFELAPFDADKIDRFVAAWYEELVRLGVVRTEEAPGLTSQLRQAVRRPDLWRLAANPLLLTVMALVHTHKGRLPDARALLYEETVDILLWRWEQIKAGGREEVPRLRQLLLDAGRTDVDLKRMLWQLAYEAHASVGAGDGEELADIGELKLEKALASLKGGDRNWAQQVVEAMKLRAGLLLERAPEVFTFPHRTFQEYLAGAHLASQADLARQAAALAAEGPLWREVILLAVGRLVYLSGDMDKPLALVGELCPEQAVDDELGWRKAWLAGDALREMGVTRAADSALGSDLLARARGRLARLVSEGKLAPRERAAAGETLSVLGDPRDFDTLIEIPAGPFLMGEDADEWARPQHEVTLAAFKIGKYPVTNGQYLRFVEATGRRWFSEDGWCAERANCAAEEISWHDARAYCAWLTELWRQEGRIAADEEVRLPTEAEWEKVASWAVGAAHVSPHKRVYPWGDEWEEDRCNSAELDLGGTCVVGMFPHGASPYGCLDMAGQVWEWTMSLWGEDWQETGFKYPYVPGDERENLKADDRVLRVLRGGSWFDDRILARCAYRNRDLPDFWFRLNGFRVVVSPVSRSAL